MGAAASHRIDNIPCGIAKKKHPQKTVRKNDILEGGPHHPTSWGWRVGVVDLMKRGWGGGGR